MCLPRPFKKQIKNSLLQFKEQIEKSLCSSRNRSRKVSAVQEIKEKINKSLCSSL